MNEEQEKAVEEAVLKALQSVGLDTIKRGPFFGIKE